MEGIAMEPVPPGGKSTRLHYLDWLQVLAVLGVFLLGLLTKRRPNWGNVIAMIASTICTTVLLILNYMQVVPLAWSWLIIIGTFITFILGYLISFREKPNPISSN